MPTSKDVWLDKKTVQARLKRSERTVEVLAARGHFVTQQVQEGSYTRTMFLEASVEAYLRARDNPQAIPLGTRRIGVMPVARPQLLAAPAAPEPATEDERPFDALPAAVRLTLREAARYLRVPLPWLRSKVEKGLLPSDDVYEGRSGIRIRKGDLDQLHTSTGKKGAGK